MQEEKTNPRRAEHAGNLKNKSLAETSFFALSYESETGWDNKDYRPYSKSSLILSLNVCSI